VNRPARELSSIWLRTPAAWMDLDLDPVTRAESIAALVEAHAVGDRDRLREMLEGAAANAVSEGAVFASLFFSTAGGQAVSASLMVSVADAEAEGDPDIDPDDAPAERLAIAQGLAEEFRKDGAKAEVRSLDAGPAARVRSRIAVDDREPPTMVDLVQYFVPFPVADRLAVLTFSTPNIGLADAFAEVFDAIGGTLQWSRQN
jgi:hypothetical protein